MMNLHYIISTILIWPMISAISAGFFTRILGKRGITLLAITCILINVILLFFWIIQLLMSNPIVPMVDFGTWIISGRLCVNWSFLFDRFNTVMLFIVNIISLFVHIYSLEYMKEDPHFPRFISYLSLFTFFMIFLVTGTNFVILFLGWEGVGLCSYLLINFWFTRIAANKAAMKALIINRIGDFGLTLGLALIFHVFQSLDFAVVFGLVPYHFNSTINILNWEIYSLTLISLLLFIGAMGKSAQIGLHTWLPDAMEGPTPVSALIHAATMVTAGVFLIIKCSPLFEYSPIVLNVLVFTGALTAFFGASVGLAQNDIKKIIAYSTCSQLGYMVFSCGLSQYHISFFHLSNHAFFKALLFLGAGSLIHALSNEQDLRKYGGLQYLMPITAITMLVGSLALTGTPFLSGFYSKDLILEVSFGSYSIVSRYAYILGIFTALLTSIYSYRIFYMSFVSYPNAPKILVKKIHESPILMTFPLTVLSFLSIAIGYLTKDFFVGLGSDFWLNAIFIHPTHYNQIDSEFIPQIYKILPIMLTLLVLFFVNLFYELNITFNSKMIHNLFWFLNQKWYFDAIYNRLFAKPVLIFAYQIVYKGIDKGLLEVFGPNFVINIITYVGSLLKQLQIGQFQLYAKQKLWVLLVIYILINIC